MPVELSSVGPHSPGTSGGTPMFGTICTDVERYLILADLINQRELYYEQLAEDYHSRPSKRLY